MDQCLVLQINVNKGEESCFQTESGIMARIQVEVLRL